MVATAQRVIAKGQSAAETNASRAAAARERIARIPSGEEVSGGLGKPMTREDFERNMREAGMTASDIRHCEQLAELKEIAGEEDWKAVRDAIMDARERAERSAVRSLWRALAGKDRASD
jgi:hypothetical protein